MRDDTTRDDTARDGTVRDDTTRDDTVRNDTTARVTRDVATFGEYEFALGGTVPELRVAYETYGEYDGDNAVLLCQPLTTSAHVARPYPDADTPSVVPAAADTDPWWNDVVGPGKAVDTEQYYVICANAPGSCYGTTGPASTDPRAGEPYGPDFPDTRMVDWTDTQRRLLDHLGVARLHAVIGGSIGGVNVLDWARRVPQRVERVVPIAATPRLRAQALALDGLARRAITADPDWNGGDYYDGPSPDHGLMLARQLGLIRYLSRDSFDQKFGVAPAEVRTDEHAAGTSDTGGGTETSDTGDDAETSPTDSDTPENTALDARCPFPLGPFADGGTYRAVESFLDYQADTFVDRFDANSYLSLVRALDEFDLATRHHEDGDPTTASRPASRPYDSDAAALAGFDGEALVLSFTGDWYYPVKRSEAITAAFHEAGVPVVHRVVESAYGHDAFLAESHLFASTLRAFLNEGVSGPTESPRGSSPRSTEVS
jgi:homoserine O-acetyltransferase